MTDDATRQVNTPPTPNVLSGGAMPVVTAPSGGANRARWAIGLGVAGVAIAATIGAIMLLGARPTPEALRYIPGDASVVAEIRMDLPGDQLQKVGNVLAHFPGFQDQATLPEKLDETLSRLVESGSGDLDYRTDIKPWLAGAAFIGTSLPDPNNPSELPSAIVSATTNGAVACTTAIEGEVTNETYQGVQLTIAGDGMLACALDGRQALLGEPAAVRAALDAKASGTGIDRSERYLAARAALAGDQLATIYVDGAALESAMPEPSLPAGMPGLGALRDIVGPIPAWTIVGIRAEDDAFVVDTIASSEAAVPATAGSAPTEAPIAMPATHPSALVGMLPADTILFAEHQGTGVALQNLLRKLHGIPELAQALGMLDSLGGTGELVGWIEDSGIAVLGTGGTPSGGVMLVTRDDASATEMADTIRSGLVFLGVSGAIDVTDETIAGITVTTIRVTDLGALPVPGGIPGGGAGIPDIPIEFSFAAKGRVLLVGVGEGFMASVLNVSAGTSLADSATYKAAAARGLGNSRATMYIGVPASIDLAEGFVPADELARWQADYLPYIEPFEVVSMTASEDGSLRRSRLVVTVSQP